jgi:hypothetical protein
MDLTADETRVVEILRDDWLDVARCTAIDQAMERAGVSFSHEKRLRVAEFLLHDVTVDRLMRWEPAVYVLTNEERLIARRILRAWRARSDLTQPAEVDPQNSALDADRISEAFETLAWLGFLMKTNQGYELARDHARFLGGLGFYFHEVVLPARKERFNTNCAPDFFFMTHPPTRQKLLERVAGLDPSAGVSDGMSLKMVEAIRGATRDARPLTESGSYGDERAILKDACGWSEEPILVVMDRGRLAEFSPATAWYLIGGG